MLDDRLDINVSRRLHWEAQYLVRDLGLPSFAHSDNASEINVPFSLLLRYALYLNTLAAMSAASGSLPSFMETSCAVLPPKLINTGLYLHVYGN